MLANVGLKRDPMAIPSCWELIKELKLNLTPEVASFNIFFL